MHGMTFEETWPGRDICHQSCHICQVTKTLFSFTFMELGYIVECLADSGFAADWSYRKSGLIRYL